MRIVAVADTHTFEGDLGALPEGDVFVHAGDMLRGGTLEELQGVASWIRGLPHRERAPSVIDYDPATGEVSLVAIPPARI